MKNKRERLLDLEQSRRRERELRKQSEALLDGLVPLGEARNTTEIFSALVEVLHNILVFEQAFLLVEDGDTFCVVAATSDELNGVTWKQGEHFSRALAGEPISIFDVNRIPGWRENAAELLPDTCSVLLVPLISTESPAMLVCTHRERGAFGQHELVLARRVSTLATQALRNIEQQRRAVEQAAREQEQQIGFQLVIEHAPDAIWMSRDNSVKYANPMLLDLLGYDDDQLSGQDAGKIIHPDDRALYQRQYEGLNRVGQSTDPHEIRLISATGKTEFVELAGLCLRIDNKPTLICLGRDITRRKELTARVMQMDRMVAVGTLAAGVGHEINNPLSFITTNMDFAARAVDVIEKSWTQTSATLDDPAGERINSYFKELKDALESARYGGERIATIVKDLNNFSNEAEELELESVDIAPLINSARKMVWNQIRHRAQYSEDIQSIPYVWGSRSHLAQAVLNLLQNAAQAIPSGNADNNEIHVSAYQKDREVIVEVRDTGTGILAEHRDHVFDPFFTTKAPDEGTGLGLSISQQDLMSFGGQISFETEVGVGTTFQMRLQIESEALPTTETMVFSDDFGDFAGRLQILIIDDEEAVGTAISRLLREYGDVVAVTRAQEAMNLLEQGEYFDAIYCDLLMPQISGMEFYRRLKQQYPAYTRRILFISGGMAMEEARRFVENVDAPFIRKPFSRDELIEALWEITQTQPAVT